MGRIVIPANMGQHAVTTTLAVRSRRDPVLLLKKAIWLYVFLLIFEGALRKWLLPSLSAPLLIIRDPVAIAIVYLGWKSKRIPQNFLTLAYVVVLMVFCGIATVQILTGVISSKLLIGTAVVAYGMRTNLLHIPLIFIIGRALDESDVLKIGRFLLMLALPMAVLMALQYKAPPTAWINTGTVWFTAGANEKISQLTSAGGHIRPPGTFTFITGAAHFWELVTAFVIYAFSRLRLYPSWLCWISAGSLIVAATVSGSRTLVLSCGLVVLFAVLIAMVRAQLMVRTSRIIFPLVVVLMLVAQLSVVQEGAKTFADRWQEADAADNHGVEGRALGYFTKAWPAMFETPFFGFGIGLGTNVGATLATGKTEFVLGEEEWVRVIQEAGAIGGVLFLLFRISVACSIATQAFCTALRGRRTLAWLLAGAAFHSVINEPLSQPTNLGFMVLMAGLCIAATRLPESVRA